MSFEFARVMAVIALVAVAACLSTPPGRLPLALRGIRKMLRKDFGVPEEKPAADAKASVWRRFVAFLLVLAAAALCVK